MLTLYGLKRQNIVFEGICSFFLFSYIYFVLWIHSVFGLLTCALVYELLPFLFLPKEFKNKTTFMGKDSFDQCIFFPFIIYMILWLLYRKYFWFYFRCAIIPSCLREERLSRLSLWRESHTQCQSLFTDSVSWIHCWEKLSY
jgi:hypothetical protein